MVFSLSSPWKMHFSRNAFISFQPNLGDSVSTANPAAAAAQDLEAVGGGVVVNRASDVRDKKKKPPKCSKLSKWLL